MFQAVELAVETVYMVHARTLEAVEVADMHMYHIYSKYGACTYLGIDMSQFIHVSPFVYLCVKNIH